jgi:hypothetical protein
MKPGDLVSLRASGNNKWVSVAPLASDDEDLSFSMLVSFAAGTLAVVIGEYLHPKQAHSDKFAIMVEGYCGWVYDDEITLVDGGEDEEG